MNKKLAFDIGAYNGDTTDDILKYYDSVICIDANPYIIDELKLKYKDNNNIKIIHGCISDSLVEKTKFYIAIDPVLCSIYKDISERFLSSKYEIFVKNINVKDIINEYELPEYIKIDIEGADIIVLNQLSTLNEFPKYISCELQWPHISNGNNKNADVEILNKLKDLGYNKFYIYDNVRQNINNKEFNKSFTDCINFENNLSYWISYNEAYNYIKSIKIDIFNWYDIFATKNYERNT